jgi:hypothetical protein
MLAGLIPISHNFGDAMPISDPANFFQEVFSRHIAFHPIARLTARDAVHWSIAIRGVQPINSSVDKFGKSRFPENTWRRIAPITIL